MSGTLMMVLIFLFVPVIIFFWNQQRIAKKVLCLFLEEDRSINQRLLPAQTDFVLDLKMGQAYYIYPDNVRFMRYPAGWPTAIQQVVPVVLYERGNGEPLDWVHLEKRVVSATEIGAAMEPEWLKNIVRGYRETSGETKMQKMLPLLSVALGAICMLLLFVVMTKFGSLEATVESLKLGR